MKLVIAEKPSVAQSLAAVLGAKERGQGYLQGNGYVVSWCVGHLIGLAAADAYDARYSKWCYEDACKQMLLFSCHKLSSPFMKTPATRDGSRWMAFITP